MHYPILLALLVFTAAPAFAQQALPAAKPVSTPAKTSATTATSGPGIRMEFAPKHGDFTSFHFEKNGNILLYGNFSAINGTPRDGYARLSANGVLDPKFNPSSKIRGMLQVAQADGKLVFAGDMEPLEGGLIRYNADGSVDSTYKPGLTSDVEDAVGLSDGKILVSLHGEKGSTGNTHLLRLNRDGTPDKTFKSEEGYYGRPLSSAIQPDGKILLCGPFAEQDGAPRSYIAKLKSDGSTDATFRADINGPVEFAQVQPDGKILISGRFNKVAGAVRQTFARLNANGTLDTAFDPKFLPGKPIGLAPLDVDPPKPRTNYAKAVDALYLQKDGKILINGYFSSVNGSPRDGFARLNPDGSLDASFSPRLSVPTTGRGRYDYAAKGTLLASGKILLRGFFTAVAGLPRDGFARLNTDGSLDDAFQAPPELTSIAETKVQPDGRLVVLALITVDGVAQKRLFRLTDKGALDLTFGRP